MKFNTLSYTPATRTMIDHFGGYNSNPVISENEFSDMLNMCFDDYPAISSSFGNYKHTFSTGGDKAIDSLTLKNSSVWATADLKSGVLLESEVLQEDVVYFIATYMGSYTTSPYDQDGFKLKRYSKTKGLEELQVVNAKLETHSIIQMGAYVVFLVSYSGKSVLYRYNTTSAKMDVIKSTIKFEASESKPIKLNFCNSKGENYTKIDFGEEFPEENVVGGDRFIKKTDDGKYEFYVYSEQYSGWFQDTDAYLKIKCDDISEKLEKDDTVYISGFEWSTNYIDAVYPTDPVFKNYLNGLQQIYEVNKEDDYALIKGFVCPVNYEGAPWVQKEGEIILDRKIPMLDCAIEHNNRIWGCRYGKNADGDYVNEIYACALGNPASWINYGSTANSAYALSLGSNGEFTGVAVQNGNVVFFKEGYIHKIYGYYPANYQLSTVEYEGVAKNAKKSLKNIDGLLYYKSCNDVYVYDGTIPQSISQKISNQFYNAIEITAANQGSDYYLIVEKADGQGKWSNDLYIYDTKRGLWCKHAAPPPLSFVLAVEYNGKVYMTNGYENLEIEDKPVTWQVTTGLLGTDNPDSKYINRLDIRMQLDGTAEASVEYDSDGQWHHIGSITAQELKSFTFPILPRRCDHFRLKLQGKGKVKIFSITKSVKGAGK